MTHDGSCTPGLTQATCDSINGSYGGHFSACTACLQPPSGEIFADAIPIPAGETIEQNTQGNLGAGGGPCGGQNPYFEPTVWFEVQGTGTTLTLSVDTTASGPGSAVAVFCNHCDNRVCVTGGSANSSGENPLDAEVSWCAGATDTYYVAVWRTGASGDVSVSLSQGGACNPTVNCDADNSCQGHCGGQAPGG